MKLIVGLGNPGAPYAHSRHNIGFEVIKSLCKHYKVRLKKEKGLPALVARLKNIPESMILSQPVTFMNLSGLAVSSLLKKYKIAHDDLLVICDDLDFEFGRIKIRPRGSSGGHRGLQSIIDALATNEFARLRVGISRPAEEREARDYVLARFSNREKAKLKGIIEKSSDCVKMWIEDGIDRAMNKFNQKE